MESLTEEVKLYLDELVRRLVHLLETQLVGVYLFGSASNNAFEPGSSDLDVQAVVKNNLPTAAKQEIVSAINQASLPCPATKLEFVVYSQKAVNPASRHPRFELNLNTGPGRSDHVGLDPGNESSHWFLLDIAMGRELGRCLHGLPTAEAFAEIPRQWILEAISDSLKWHQANEISSANSVLNACRSLQYIACGKWSSKMEGAKWMMQQSDCPAVVEKAIVARRTGQELPTAQVKELYDIAMVASDESLGR
ncbi:streptomycin 3 adenylyltransferase [Fusarium beomiforme]|uniref:Streptomycin 3 adenylyltransferase n=1 Tax=Fusarium beomiforme TaxID=44412 RepID=A0A9P5AAX2_9HYPO|nr:streptomycin 3 adenylyltransferase [Fusarium beomiforme]